MIVLGKKAKIITGILIFAAVAAVGYAIEHFEKDAFVEEVVAKEDAVSYVEPESGENEAGLININKADTETLSMLTGIGQSIAERIVDFRENNGGFGTIEEIMNVPGISEKKFEMIKDDISVE